MTGAGPMLKPDALVARGHEMPRQADHAGQSHFGAQDAAVAGSVRVSRRLLLLEKVTSHRLNRTGTSISAGLTRLSSGRKGVNG